MNPHVQVHLIPVLTDNYIHVLHDGARNLTIVVDPAEAQPVMDFLSKKHWNLDYIFVTHHHADHIGGVPQLKEATGARVVGSRADRHRLPFLEEDFVHGDTLSAHDMIFEIWDLPGHTSGHIGFIAREQKIAFTGDVLFGMGCGRIFEGTFEQAFESLQLFRNLDPDTRVYCTHEYTEKNIEFALSQYPNHTPTIQRQRQTSKIRAAGLPTVPLTMSEELATNPFLLATNLEEFTRLRQLRNQF